MLSLTEWERVRCNPNIWLMPDPTHSPHKPLAAKPCHSGTSSVVGRSRVWIWDCQALPMWKYGTKMTGNVLRQLYKGFKLFLQLISLLLTALLQYCRWGKGVPAWKRGLQSNHLHMQHYTALQGKGEAMIHWKHFEAVDFCQNLSHVHLHRNYSHNPVMIMFFLKYLLMLLL